MLYALAITVAKISILLFYRRIFNTIVTFRYAIYIIGGFCLLWFLVVMLVSALQCQPVSYAWDKSLVGGTCIDLRAMYYGFTISNMVLDVIINVMPVRLIWKLHLSIKKRILLTFIMLFGIMRVTGPVQLATFADPLKCHCRQRWQNRQCDETRREGDLRSVFIPCSIFTSADLFFKPRFSCPSCPP